MTVLGEYVHLPPPLSKLVGDVASSSARDLRLRTHLWWQDADVWVLYREEPLTDPEVAILTRRVVIAAYELAGPDHPTWGAELRFMPEVVVQRSDTTLVAPPDQREAWATDFARSVQDLWTEFVRDPAGLADAAADIRTRINGAWTRAEGLDPGAATESVW